MNPLSHFPVRVAHAGGGDGPVVSGGRRADRRSGVVALTRWSLPVLMALVVTACSSGGLTSPSDEVAGDDGAGSTFGYLLDPVPAGYERCAVAGRSGLEVSADDSPSVRVYGQAGLDDPYAGPLYGVAVFRLGNPGEVPSPDELTPVDAVEVDLDGRPARLSAIDSLVLASLPPDAGRLLTWVLDDGRVVQLAVRGDDTADLVAIAAGVEVGDDGATIDPAVLPVDAVDLGDLYQLEGQARFLFSVDHQRPLGAESAGETGDADESGEGVGTAEPAGDTAEGDEGADGAAAVDDGEGADGAAAVDDSEGADGAAAVDDGEGADGAAAVDDGDATETTDGPGAPGEIDDQLTLLGSQGDRASMEAFRFRVPSSRRVEVAGVPGVVAELGTGDDGPWVVSWMPEDDLILRIFSFRIRPDALVELAATARRVDGDEWAALTADGGVGTCTP